MLGCSFAINSGTPRTVPCGLHCPWGISRQEHWSGLPYPPPGRTTVWSSNSTLRHKSKEIKNPVIFSPMFTEALFTIAKIWKKPKCSSTDEWIKKMWKTDNQCTQPLKKKEILLFVMPWMDLEDIMLSEIIRKPNTVWYHLYVEF